MNPSIEPEGAVSGNVKTTTPTTHERVMYVDTCSVEGRPGAVRRRVTRMQRADSFFLDVLVRPSKRRAGMHGWQIMTMG